MADDQLKQSQPTNPPTEQDYTLTDPQLRAGMSMNPQQLLGSLQSAQDFVMGPTPREIPGQPEPGLTDVGMLDPIDYAVGAIPTAAKGARKILGNEIGSLKLPGALDLTPTARTARAVEQGYNPHETWFHGTKADIEAFSPEALGASTSAPSAKRGYFFTRDAETASDYAVASKSRGELKAAADNKTLKHGQSYKDFYKELDDVVENDDKIKGLKDKISSMYETMGKEYDPAKKWVDQSQLYKDLSTDSTFLQNDVIRRSREIEKEMRTHGANVIPAHLKMDNPYIHDFGGKSYRDQTYNDILAKAKELGHDSVILKNTYDPGNLKNKKLIDVGVVFEPHQIRSKWAEFDPAKIGKSGLSYAAGGVVQNFADGGMTTPIYDISGTSPVLGDISHEEVQDAITSGQYSFPRGKEINVFSPDGQLGTISAHEAPEAFKAGYKYAPPQAIHQYQEEQAYTSPLQKTFAATEALGRGLVTSTGMAAAEKGLGIPTEAILKRQQYNPYTAGAAEIGGLGIGSIYGVGEAKLLGMVGEGAQAISGLGKAATVGERLAAGTVKAAADFAAYEADKVAARVIQDVPVTPGQAASDVLLSGLLGGAFGLGTTAIGMGAKSAWNNRIIQDFKGRLAYRNSGVIPAEALGHELTEAVNAFHTIGDEVNGVTGLKAQAIENLLPKEVTKKVVDSVQEVIQKSQETLEQMIKKDAPKRLINDYEQLSAKFIQDVTNPEATNGTYFEALNQFKNDLQGYSKGRYGIHAIQRTAEDYNFVNLTKSLAHDVRTGLENPSVWEDAAHVQKDINAAWRATLPYVKQVTTGFMSKVGDNYVIDPAKFKSYISQSGKATSETIRQQRLGGFLKGLDQFHDTIANITEKTGIETGVSPPNLTTLRESVNKSSTGSRLADHWFDKLAPTGLGDVMGGGAGMLLGHAVPIPGSEAIGGYLGKWALGPVFSSLIKPILENGVNMPGMKASGNYVKAVMNGHATMTKAAASLFESGIKTIPDHLYPTHKDNEKLDKQIREAHLNPLSLIKNGEQVAHYLPDHASELTKTAMTAADYLNSIRPFNPKMSPLDTEMPVSDMQKAAYERQLELANQPLMLMKHVKDGTLQPNDMKTVMTIYPAYYKELVMTFSDAMIQHISDGNAVPYKLRQSASLFLGQPLDSTMTPWSIQAIQKTFLVKNVNQQQQAKETKKGTSKLGQTSENMLSANQARQQRSNQA